MTDLNGKLLEVFTRVMTELPSVVEGICSKYNLNITLDIEEIATNIRRIKLNGTSYTGHTRESIFEVRYEPPLLAMHFIIYAEQMSLLSAEKLVMYNVSDPTTNEVARILLEAKYGIRFLPRN